MAVNGNLNRVGVGPPSIRFGPLRRRFGIRFWIVISTVIAVTSLHGAYAAKATAKPRTVLKGITVKAPRGVRDGLYVSGQNTGLRMPASNMDVPQSVQVVPHSILQQQRAISPNAAMRNVSGVSASQPAYSPFQRYTIRGFPANNYYTDGLLDIGLDRTYWLGNIERIEVLKGPASVLYGGGDLGGIINYVTKKPSVRPRLRALASVGSDNFRQLSVDATGPANASHSITYRVIGDLQGGDSFIDRFKSRGNFLSGVLHASLTSETAVDLQMQFRRRAQDQFGRVGLPAYGTVIGLDDVRLPISRNFNENFASRTDFEDFLGGKLTHRFNAEWTFESHFRATYFYYSQGRISPKLQADNRTLDRDVFFVDSHEQDYRLNNMLVGRFDTFGLGHRMLIGLQFSRHLINYDDATADLAPINIVAPLHGASPTHRKVRNRQHIDFDTVGAYADDVISVLPQVDVVLGARYDYSARSLVDTVTGADQSAYNARFSPRAGVVYKPVPWAAWYASYSTSFEPVNDVTSLRTKGILYAPERGQQYETGIKFNVAPRLVSTLAVYQIKRKNVLTTDPADPTMRIAVGEQRSRGVDFNLSWSGMRGWNVLFDYAYTNALVTQDNKIKVGNRAANVPRQSVRLWTSYEIQSGALSGFSVGAGLYHAGMRFGDAANSFELPSYTTVDASLSYPWARYRFGVHFGNILDERYFVAASSRNSVFPGTPFTVMGTVRAQF